MLMAQSSAEWYGPFGPVPGDAASGASDQYHDWKSPAAVCTGALESADRRPVMQAAG